MGIPATQKIKNINEINWNETIKSIKNSGPVKGQRDSGFWDKRAPSFADHAKESLYPDSFLEIMNPDPSWTALDVGCGGGTISIPMAPMVKHITAVDFSPKMLGILKEEALKRQITNIDTIEASWTDNWDEKGIKTYDVVIASRSIAVDNVQEAFTKLNNAARKRVIISTVAGDGPHDRKLYESVGRQFSAKVDYIYFYNLLYQMGIFANISFISTERAKTFKSIEEACESVIWMFHDITEQEKILLNKFMKDHLVETDKGLTMKYQNKSTWAVIWWDK